jgi:hypothetical protein
MSKTKCRNGENCRYYQQNICKFSHNELITSYKNISIKDDEEFVLSEESLSLLSNIKEEDTNKFVLFKKSISSNIKQENKEDNKFILSEKSILLNIKQENDTDKFMLSEELSNIKQENKQMLYIRHAEKQYKNGKNKKYSLDPDITEKGKIEALNKFKLLLDQYGVPERIITSPYLRTRSTAEIASLLIFEQMHINIEIEYDNQLGECLQHQSDKDLNICLRPETLIHNPISDKKLKKYKNRINNHTKKSQYNTWYITHGFNIFTIASIKGYNIKHPRELCGIAIDSDGKVTNI